MTYSLYHNPRCSKSRQAKALLEEAHVEFEEVLYLKAGLDAAHYAALLTQLGGEPVTHLRKGEDAFKALPDGATLEQIAQAIEANPILLERPVLVSPKGALVCRPPERVQDLI